MARRFLIMAGLMVLTIFASTRVAQAQDHLLVVRVPFNFMAGNVNLSAGNYTVKTGAATTSVLLISRVDANQSAFVAANSARSADLQRETKLVFNRYGDRYFLSQVWTAGSPSGKQLMKSAREKEMAQVASNQGQVVLVADLTR